MGTKIFNHWFRLFAEDVQTRSLLQIFDGHMTRLSTATVDFATEQNISLIKLPAHCTDVLQPPGCGLL